MKSQVQKKEKKNRMVELLIPTLNKILRNPDTYSVVFMNNRLKIISGSVHGAPLTVWEDFFQKKSFSWGDKKIFGAKKLWEGCSKLED